MRRIVVLTYTTLARRRQHNALVSHNIIIEDDAVSVLQYQWAGTFPEHITIKTAVNYDSRV